MFTKKRSGMVSSHEELHLVMVSSSTRPGSSTVKETAFLQNEFIHERLVMNTLPLIIRDLKASDSIK